MTTHPMKVLIVTGIFPPDIGGPATYVPQIATALADRGYNITVITLSDYSPFTTDYLFPVVRLRRGFFRPLRFILTVLTLLRWGGQVDLLFVNGLYLEAVIANFFLRKPLVQKVVGDWAWERATNKRWIADNFETFQTAHYKLRATRYALHAQALKALRAWWTRQADRVIVPSRYLARWVANWGIPKEKIAVIYNAVAPLSRAPSQGEGRGDSPSSVKGLQLAQIPLPTSVKVVTVGRLVPWKQVDHLIEAIVPCDGAGLVIVGDGPERGQLEELVRTLELADRVYFAGPRSREETLSLMAACDLFVLNSTYEGFPHTVLEAMSLGLPVVTTTVGGTPEVVQNEESGLLIAPAANGALSQALLKLVSSPLERQRLGGGAKHAMERFCLSAMVEATEAVLRNSVDLHGER